MTKFLLLFLLMYAFLPVLGQGNYLTMQMHSNSLGTQRNISVYLPPSYNNSDSLRYPVIYYLHGANGNNDSEWFIKDTLNAMINSGRIKPVIVVKPDGSAPPYLGSFYTNSELYGAMEDFVINDLIAFIDSTFKTLPVKERRGIMGTSMGGFGAMKLAFKHPELFAGTASNSGPLDLSKLPGLVPRILSESGGVPPYNFNPNNGTFSKLAYTMAGAFSPNLSKPFFVDFILDNNGNIIDSIYQKWLINSPARLAKTFNYGSALSIYFDCGTFDELGMYAFNTGFNDTLNLLNITHSFRSFTGFHYLNIASRLPVLFRFLDTVMQHHILPVELISFTAEIKGSSVYLKWSTVTEINNLGFEVQRKVNDTWEVLSFVKGYGNSVIRNNYNYTDKYTGNGCSYRLKQIDTDGSVQYSSIIYVRRDKPVNLELAQNYPNPFNPETTISFFMPEKSGVVLKVHDITGREVSVLVNQVMESGYHTVSFSGKGISSGLYIYSLNASGKIKTGKMLLMK